MKTTHFLTVKLKKKKIVLLEKRVRGEKSKKRKKNGETITQRRYNAYQSDTNCYWLDYESRV